MYTTLGYLYDQIHNVIVDVGTTDRMFRRMYARPVRLSYGINNPIKFRILNNQQRTINVSGYKFTLHIMDPSTNLLVFTKDLHVEDSNRGIVSTVLYEYELSTLKRSDYNYSLSCYIDGLEVPVYVNDNYNTRGNLYIDFRAYPSGETTEKIYIGLDEPTSTTFKSNFVFVPNGRYYTTVAIYATNFEGTLTFKSSLMSDTSKVNDEDLFISHQKVYDNIEPLTGIYYFNLEGFYAAHRLEIDLIDGSVEKVLIRY